MTDSVETPVNQADIDELLTICQRTFGHPGPDGVLRRQIHAKTIACLDGGLTIQPVDDPATRHGLFAKPGRYRALVRFSNSFFDNDAHPDVRGLAIKLTGVGDDVAGEVVDGAPPGIQDFVLMNQSFGPAKDAAETLDMFRALDGIKKISLFSVLAPRYLFPSWAPWRFRWRYLNFLNVSGLNFARGLDLGRTVFHSVTPYRLGDDATQYVVRPDAAARRRRSARGGDFAARLQAILDQGPMGFEFCLQPRTGGDSIEDARRAWRGPVHVVGHLEIPPQNVAATIALGDQLTASPWNCLKAHAPLGSINALRRPAYAASAANRRAHAVPPS